MRSTIAALPREMLPNSRRIDAGRAAAQRCFPPEVAALVCNELENWAEFGYRIGGKHRIERLIDELLEAE